MLKLAKVCDAEQGFFHSQTLIKGCFPGIQELKANYRVERSHVAQDVAALRIFEVDEPHALCIVYQNIIVVQIAMGNALICRIDERSPFDDPKRIGEESLYCQAGKTEVIVTDGDGWKGTFNSVFQLFYMAAKLATIIH